MERVNIMEFGSKVSALCGAEAGGGQMEEMDLRE